MRTHDLFKLRMMAQARQIRRYKKTLEQQGRNLSLEEAALEWISRYASEFPSLAR